MNTATVLPRLFEAQNQFHHLKVTDFSCIEYRSSNDARQVKILVTTYLFVVVLSGEKIIHREHGDLHIGAGNAFFARKGAYLFSEILASADEYRTLVFCIDDSFLKKFLQAHPDITGKPGPISKEGIFQILLTPLLQASVQSLLPYFVHTSSHNESLLRLKLEEILLHIIDADSKGRFAAFLCGLQSTRRRNILKVMDEYYNKPLTLEEFAKLSGRSLSSFKRDFRALFQQSPRHWINSRRLEQARMILSSTDTSVSEVCFEVGFENISHFSQLFKKKYGCTPSSVKRQGVGLAVDIFD